MEPLRGDKKYTGFILKSGILHLYKDANDLVDDMKKWGEDWSRVAWIEGIVLHGSAGKVEDLNG